MPPRKRTIDDSQAGDGPAAAPPPSRRGGGAAAAAAAAAAGGKASAAAPPAPASAAPDDAPLKLKMVQVETSGDDSARWNGAFASFAADLRASSEMSDVTVVSKGGEKTPAHRWVLAARSEMLRAKLGNPGFPEGREGLVPMDEDNAVVQCLLDYMYSGQVSMSVAIKHVPQDSWKTGGHGRCPWPSPGPAQKINKTYKDQTLCAFFFFLLCDVQKIVEKDTTRILS